MYIVCMILFRSIFYVFHAVIKIWSGMPYCMIVIRMARVFGLAVILIR